MSKLFRVFASMCFVATLAACGGGGGAAGGTGTTTGTGTGTGTSTGTTTSTGPVLSWTLTDASGVIIDPAVLSGGDTGTLSVKFVSATGSPLANALVTITADANLAQLIPASGTALTDASGVAVIKIKPASFTAAGAFALTGQAVLGTLTATFSKNMSVGAAPLTVGTLVFAIAPPATLPAFSAVVINIPVTSKGVSVTSVTGLSLTSLCVGDGKATLVQGGATSGFAATATYTNNGCTRGTDIITASLSNSSQSISIGVSAANIGTIQFIGTDTAGTALVLKGSGGAGRKESAVVTFKLVDQNNQGLGGVRVDFSATTTTGGLTVSPAFANTSSDPLSLGMVTTTVSSGTIPTPVKVIATASRLGTTISGLSDFLTISTGLPIQKSMSLSADKLNIEGWNYDGEPANVTIRMADQYGNPVADNTTVNFVTEGGSIASSSQGACNTMNGACTVQLISQDFRPLDGRVTVLAYAQGIKTFTDTTGDGQYSCSDPTDINGIPLVDNTKYRPLIDTCRSGGEPYLPQGDAFLDANFDKTFNAGSDLPFPYNHTGYVATDDGKWGITYINRTFEIIFSGSDARLIRLDCTSGTCVDWTAPKPGVIAGVAGAACSSQSLDFRLTDLHNNPLAAGTKVGGGDVDKLSLLTFYPDSVVSTNGIGGTQHHVTVKSDTACADGFVTVVVKTPKGNSTAFTFTSK